MASVGQSLFGQGERRVGVYFGSAEFPLVGQRETPSSDFFASGRRSVAVEKVLAAAAAAAFLVSHRRREWHYTKVR